MEKMKMRYTDEMRQKIVNDAYKYGTFKSAEMNNVAPQTISVWKRLYGITLTKEELIDSVILRKEVAGNQKTRSYYAPAIKDLVRKTLKKSIEEGTYKETVDRLSIDYSIPARTLRGWCKRF